MTDPKTSIYRSNFISELFIRTSKISSFSSFKIYVETVNYVLNYMSFLNFDLILRDYIRAKYNFKKYIIIDKCDLKGQGFVLLLFYSTVVRV